MLKSCPLHTDELSLQQSSQLPYRPYMHAFGNQGALLHTCTPSQFMGAARHLQQIPIPLPITQSRMLIRQIPWMVRMDGR